MSATNEPKRSGDESMRPDGAGERVEALAPDAQIRRAALEEIGRQLITLLGDDVSRDGLKDTPRRFAKWWDEFARYTDDNTDTTFELLNTSQMIVVSPIRVWSICEHHLLPFYVDISIGYIPAGRLLGLSKFARIAQVCAHHLTVQELLCRSIAEKVQLATGSQDVAVYGKGEHLCMTMRGIKSESHMITSQLFGAFLQEFETRAEFFQLLGVHK